MTEDIIDAIYVEMKACRRSKQHWTMNTIVYIVPEKANIKRCLDAVVEKHGTEIDKQNAKVVTVEDVRREDISNENDIRTAIPLCRECGNAKNFFDRDEAWYCTLCEQ